MIKSRHIYQVHVLDCPMGYENCLGCPFFCGIVTKVNEPSGPAVSCGWDKKLQERMQNQLHVIGIN